MKHDKKVALITGSNGGIGEAIARIFVSKGFTVVIHGRSEGKTENTVQSILEQGGAGIGIAAEIDQYPGAQDLFEQVVKQTGKIDVLVNNAGISKPRPAKSIKIEDWKKVVDTNLNGTFYCCQLAQPLMEKNGGGTIVNISSVLGKLSKFGRSAYSSSKAGVDGLTRNLAIEWSKYNIRINGVAPGITLTPPIKKMIEQGKFGKSYEEIEQTIPLGRIGNPDEVAKTVYFLSSEDSSYITGQTVYVDGGRSIISPS